MSKRLHRHANLLRTLHKASPAIRKRLLKQHCDGDFVSCITECVKNLLKGNVPLNSAQKKKLSAKKKILRQIALKKTSLGKKQKLIQSGGFLGALLGPIVSVLGGLFNGAR
jgi:hypothetical protein